MNETMTMAFDLLVGVWLGIFFFGGLWWTVEEGLTSKHPALWFLGSSLLRMAIAVGGFHLLAGGDWRNVLITLAGFIIGRIVVIRLTRALPAELFLQPQAKGENHAP